MTCLILCAYLYTDILVVVDESGHLVVVQHVTVNTVLTVDHCFFAKPGRMTIIVLHIKAASGRIATLFSFTNMHF